MTWSIIWSLLLILYVFIVTFFGIRSIRNEARAYKEHLRNDYDDNGRLKAGKNRWIH